MVWNPHFIISLEFNKLPWEAERIRTAVLTKSDGVAFPSISTEVDFVNNSLGSFFFK